MCVCVGGGGGCRQIDRGLYLLRKTPRGFQLLLQICILSERLPVIDTVLYFLREASSYWYNFVFVRETSSYWYSFVFAPRDFQLLIQFCICTERLPVIDTVLYLLRETSSYWYSFVFAPRDFQLLIQFCICSERPFSYYSAVFGELL